MNRLLCDSGPLIATFNKKESQHQRCVRLLAEWPGRLLVPEPVLGETCNFLRNNVPRGAAAEIRFLRAMLEERGDFDIIDPYRKIAFAPPSWPIVW